MEKKLTNKQNIFVESVLLVQDSRRRRGIVPDLAPSSEVMRVSGMPLHEVERIGAELGAAGVAELHPSLNVMLYGIINHDAVEVKENKER